MPRPSRWNDVVEAAAIVFARKGFGGTTLEDIADEVGMLKGSLYNYISSKDDLLAAVSRPFVDSMLDRTRRAAAEDLPAGERLRRTAMAFAELLEGQFAFASVHIWEVIGRTTNPDWIAAHAEYLRLIAGVIQDGQSRGELEPGLDPRVAALTMVGSLNWMTKWLDEGESAEAAANRIMDVLLGGMYLRR